MPITRHDRLNIAGATGLAVAAGALYLPPLLKGDKPVKHGAVPVALSKYTGKIAQIPVAENEVAEARKEARSSWGTAKVLHIDKKTGQPYNLLHDDDPNLANVMRVIPARDGSGKYSFSVGQRLDAKGNLDPTEVVSLTAEVIPAGGEDGDVEVDVYDRDANTPTVAGKVALKMAKNWGAEITNDHHIVKDMTVGPNSTTLGPNVLTSGRFGDISSFFNQAVNAASSGAPISDVKIPDWFQGHSN